MNIGPYELDQIYTGDARELAKAIPDESVDLIFTDPPWDGNSLSLYDFVARFSQRTLKPGGYVAAYCGNQWLADIMLIFSSLVYHRTLACIQMNSDDKAYDVRIFSLWRPVPIWKKSGGKPHGWIPDAQYSIRDKRFHPWGQSELPTIRWITGLTDSDSIIIDPFCGGGTVPAVCKMLGRHYLAFEIDPDTAERARQRVAMTQPPLLIPEPEQARFEDME